MAEKEGGDHNEDHSVRHMFYDRLATDLTQGDDHAREFSEGWLARNREKVIADAQKGNLAARIVCTAFGIKYN